MGSISFVRFAGGESGSGIGADLTAGVPMSCAIMVVQDGLAEKVEDGASGRVVPCALRVNVF